MSSSSSSSSTYFKHTVLVKLKSSVTSAEAKVMCDDAYKAHVNISGVHNLLVVHQSSQPTWDGYHDSSKGFSMLLQVDFENEEGYKGWSKDASHLQFLKDFAVKFAEETIVFDATVPGSIKK